MSNQLQDNLDAILQDKNTNLKPENLKEGVTCLGVEGTMDSGIDTSDATATANDIINPKTAYVNGEKIIGSIMPTYEDIIEETYTNNEFDDTYRTNTSAYRTSTTDGKYVIVGRYTTVNIYKLNNNVYEQVISNISIRTIFKFSSCWM